MTKTKLRRLKLLVKRATEERPRSKLARYSCSGYIGIDYVAVRLPEWREICAIIEERT